MEMVTEFCYNVKEIESVSTLYCTVTEIAL